MRANLRAAFAIVAKDLAVWRRRPIAILLTLAPPFVFVLVMLISAGSVGRSPVALVVLDPEPQAQALAARIESSDAFKVRRADPASAQHELDQLVVAAIVTIPADFDARFDAHEPDPVTIRIDNLNLDYTNDLRRSLPAAITAFYADQAASAVNVAMRETDLRPRDVSLLQFELVPNLVLLLVVAGAVNGGLGVSSEFEGQTISELVLAPVSRAALIGGKLLAGWVTAMVVALVVIVLGAATGYLQPRGVYWLPTVLVVALIALAAAGVGAALGARLRKLARVGPVAINLSIWLFFLSGGISVAAFLPSWVQTVAALTPTYYGVHALQMSIFYGSTDQLARDIAVLLATALAGLVLGTASLRRSTVG